MVAAMTELAVKATGQAPPETVGAELGKNRLGMVTTGKAMTREEIDKVAAHLKGEIADVILNFSAEVPALLKRLAVYEPDKALRLYKDMAEFLVQKPKQEVDVKAQVATFVRVEAREVAPEEEAELARIEAKQIIDAAFSEVAPVKAEIDGEG